MKKSMLLLSLFLVGNLAQAGIASKAACWGTLLLPTALLEGLKIRLASTNMKDITDNLELVHAISPACCFDNRPYGNTHVFINDSFKKQPHLYDAVKALEEAHITNYHLLKRNLLAETSPFLFYFTTSPLAKIPNRIARASRPVIAFGLWLGSLTALMRQQEYEADSAIQDPNQIEAFKTYLDRIKKFHTKTGWFATHPCPEERVKFLNDRLAQMQSKKI
jgi:hypothetical protein